MAKDVGVFDSRKVLAAVATLGQGFQEQVQSRFNGSLKTQGGSLSASHLVSNLLKQMPDHERQALCMVSRVIG
jgi:hypothetical protein